jgi:hypothetical protein
MFEPASGVQKRFPAAIAPDESVATSSRVLTMLIFFIFCSLFIVLSLSLDMSLAARQPG